MRPQEMLDVELMPDVATESSDQFEAEKKAFWAMRAELLDQYEGFYVAIYQGRVVDHDSDKLKLGLRVYNKFGYCPIYVQLVTRKGLSVKYIPSPRIVEQAR
jgi:hypothetical protein